MLSGAPRMPTITSRRHPLVQRYRQLARGRAADEHDALAPIEVLLDGSHLVRDALDAGCTIRHAAFTRAARARPEGEALGAALTHRRVEMCDVTDEVMGALSPVKTPSGIVAIAQRPRVRVGEVFARAPQLVVLAIDVQDPGNVGAMIRAAEAGGATGLVACGATADPFGWRALRGSMGSALRLLVARASTREALAAASEHRVPIVAAGARGGRPAFDLDLRGPIAFALGGEGAGLPGDVIAGASAFATIPMAPPVESLNVAIATALLVYEARRQRGW